MKGKFTIEKKLVVQVRYYEQMYVIRDGEGERVYTGNDEKTARRVQAVLNSYHSRQDRKRVKPVKRKRKPRK